MALAVGDTLPEVKLGSLTENGLQQISSSDFFAGKRVVLFGVPGAFTPTCSDVHLPGFIAKAEEIKAKGIDTVACIATNDPFVMAAWGKARQVGDIVMLADGNAELARAMGLDLDLSGLNLGIRNKRYAAIIDDGVVQMLNVEPGREVGVSSAEAVLEALG